MSYPIRYVVRATLHDPIHLEEYLAWLTDGGHVTEVLSKGKASSGEVVVLDVGDGAVMVESSYIFPSRSVFDSYMAGPALELRKDGVSRFVDTGKCVFTRTIGEIRFSA